MRSAASPRGLQQIADKINRLQNPDVYLPILDNDLAHAERPRSEEIYQISETPKRS